MRNKQGKSGFTAAFFSLVAACLSAVCPAVALASDAPTEAPHWSIAEIQTQALDKHLDEDKVWQALLHVRDQAPQIRDPRFILSLESFSAKRELLATIAYLYDRDAPQAVCQFPARYTWLRSQLPVPELPLHHCDELKEFVTRAPATTISLVFASENLSQPASVMGHLFLKVSGVNGQGRHVEHAISFFTDATTLNLPKLFYDSMVIGKKGFFALTPYQREVDNYVATEERTLWEYELRLRPLERALLQQHMHELRHADITYFFQSYNCATLVKHLLAIGKPDMLDGQSWWTTPTAVLRRAQEIGIITAPTVKTPSKWLVRTLQTTLSAAQSETVRASVEARDSLALDRLPVAEPRQGFLALELARAYNTYLYEQKVVGPENWSDFNQKLDAIERTHFTDLMLETDQRKNPAFTPGDKQISMGWLRLAGQNHLKLGLLPVSHTLADNNSQHLSESELRLFDAALLVDARSGRTSLDHLTIASTQSLLPRDPFTGGVSGRFRLGLEQQPTTTLQGKTALLIEGGLGLTWRPAPDIDFFVLLGGGVGYRQHSYAYVNPSMGMLIREVYDMKSIISLSSVSRPMGERSPATEVSLTQSKYLGAQNTLVMEVRRLWQAERSATQVGVSIKRLF